MNTKSMLYKKLELNPGSMPELNGQQEEAGDLNPTSWLSSVWQFLIDALIGGHQPKIWQRTDRVGNTWWYAQNPATGRTVCLASEEEVRIWLDQLYR